MLKSGDRYSLKRYVLITLFLTLFIVAAALSIVGLSQLVLLVSGLQVTATFIASLKAFGALIISYTPAFLANAVSLIAAKLGSILSLGGYLTSALSYVFNNLVSSAYIFSNLLMVQGQIFTLASIGTVGTALAGVAVSVAEIFVFLLVPIYAIDTLSHKLTGFAPFAFIAETASNLGRLFLSRSLKKADTDSSESDTDEPEAPPAPPASPVSPLMGPTVVMPSVPRDPLPTAADALPPVLVSSPTTPSP
ncbi:MAG: hypothetical protein KBD64_04860 [Gammaproteobacteria bacterium]|nr:hypothetical protein [Gammaproteobacteria bacterium]